MKYPVHGHLCTKKPAHQARRYLSMQDQTTPYNALLSTAGGQIVCPRCQAKSKRTGLQCGAPALTGRRTCRFHGGMSTGPRTPEGRQRCAAARTIHGQQTRQARTEMALDARRLRTLETLGVLSRMIPGPRLRGRKPKAL